MYMYRARLTALRGVYMWSGETKTMIMKHEKTVIAFKVRKKDAAGLKRLMRKILVNKGYTLYKKRNV